MHPFLSIQQISLEQPIEIPRCDRWRIHHRLQELNISSSCPADGSLRVEVHNGIEMLLIHSIIQQFTAPRQDLVSWLERCWSTTERCKKNH